MARRRSRRAKGEGSLSKRSRRRKDGSVHVVWRSDVTVGYSDDGKQVRKTLYGKTQAEVLDKVTELRGQLKAGMVSMNRTTVGEYLDEWLSYKKLEVKARTHQFYADYIRLYLKPSLARIQLSKLTAFHVQTMMKQVAHDVSADAANKARSLLFTALKQAVRLGLISTNPAEAVDKLKHEPSEMTLWTPEQVRHFLKVAKSHRLYAAFYLVMATGMRHGEILGLRWQDIEGDVITVRQSVINVKGAQHEISTPKTRKGVRRIVIDPATMQVLAEHRGRQEAEREKLGSAWEDLGLVFPNECVFLPKPDTCSD